MHRLPVLLALLAGLYACNNDSATTSGSTPARLDSAISTPAPPAPNTVVEHRAPFSDPARPDRFRLEVGPGPLRSAQVRFTIENPDGQVIHEETFGTIDLLGFEAMEDTTAAGQEAIIRRRLETFFAPSQFLTPAVKPGDRLAGDEERQADWDEIRSDPSAIGFSYLLGKEDGRRIAWSKKRKKVVLYFNCC